MKKFIMYILGTTAIIPLIACAGVTYCPKNVWYDGVNNPPKVSISGTTWTFNVNTSSGNLSQGQYYFTSAKYITNTKAGVCDFYLMTVNGVLDLNQHFSYEADKLDYLGENWQPIGDDYECGQKGQILNPRSCTYSNSKL